MKMNLLSNPVQAMALRRPIHWRAIAQSGVAHTLVIITAFAIGLPFFYMVTTSFKTLQEVYTVPIQWLPSNWNLENYVAAWNGVPMARSRFQKLFQAGQAYLPTKADGNALAYFGSGKGAMLIESTGVIGRVDETAGGRFKPGVSYLPEGTAGRKVPTGGAGLCIMAGRTPEKKQAAWEFIRWMEQPEQIARYSKVSGYLPYTKKAADSMKDVMDKDPRRKVAVEQLAWSRGQSTIQTVPRAVDVYYDAMLQVLNLKADPKTLMPQIQKQVQAILVEEGLKK